MDRPACGPARNGGDEVAALAEAFNEMAGTLEERGRALAQADRARRQLLADVSHELSTPLAAIRGYVETLSMPELRTDQPTRDRYLAIVADEAHRLDRLVGDLLELARLEGQPQAVKPAPVPVEPLLGRLADSFHPALMRAAVTLSISVEPADLVITADAGRLQQALQNLVANAIRHTPSGGTIRVSVASEGTEAVLTVDDSGAGIPEEHLPRVFDRFYKADASRAGQPLSGSGLGLSIVRAIVTAHGGTVSAGNRPEGGARFVIRLPTA